MKPEHVKYMGARVKDVVTDASGVVSCISYYLNGCVRLLVELPIREGKLDTFWCDIQQAKIVKPNVVPHAGAASMGGPRRSEAPRG